MKDLLSLFRIFYGPLNEICVQGFDDSDHSLRIERWIKETKKLKHHLFFESFIYIHRLHHHLIDHGDRAQEAYSQAVSLTINAVHQCQLQRSSIFDDIPMADFRLLLMITFVFDVHDMMSNFMPYRPQSYYESSHLPGLAKSEFILKGALRENFPEQMISSRHFMAGLYRIFCHVPDTVNTSHWLVIIR
jgi:hypothetical protein